ncbi:MAG: S8 family peptidase [bacterium]
MGDGVRKGKWPVILGPGCVLGVLFCLFFRVESFAFLPFPMRCAPHPLYAPQEVLVRFVDWASYSDIQGILDSCGAHERHHLHHTIPLYSVTLALPVEVEQVASFLELLPFVRYAEPNYYVEAEFVPNDPIYIYQWHLGMINMETAWDVQNGSGAVVAVLDTGAAYRNALPYAQAPDLAGTAILPGWDFVNDDPYPDDDHGHGTHITGTIAQTTNNLLGCAGVAFGCSIMPIKVLDENSNGLLDDVVAGIYFAVDNGAQIINTSFGTVISSLTLEEAVTYANLNKVTMVCSAGNGASSAPHYPSSYPECISVSAIKYDQTLAFYSNYGSDIDICAPGGSLAYDQNLDGKPDGIVQQTHNGIDLQTFDYYIFQGTSCAAAHVTGVAALIVAATGGALGPDLIQSTLVSTARDIGAVGWDQYFGAGLVDAAAALASLPVIATAASVSPLQPLLPPFSAPYGAYVSAGSTPLAYSPSWEGVVGMYQGSPWMKQSVIQYVPFNPTSYRASPFGAMGAYPARLQGLQQGPWTMPGYMPFSGVFVRGIPSMSPFPSTFSARRYPWPSNNSGWRWF